MRFLDNYRVEITCQNGRKLEDVFKMNQRYSLDRGAYIELRHGKCKEVSEAWLELNLKDEESWQNDSLIMNAPVKLYLSPNEKPEKMMAIYMFSEWWSRPAFISKYQEIPALTQVLFLKFTQKVVCFLPMVGDDFRASCHGGSDSEICIEMTAGMAGAQSLKEPVCILAEANTAAEAAKYAFLKAAEYKGIRTRNERRLPDMFRYLGWCSWNAFYTDVDEQGIRAKAQELTEKQVPVKWMLIDDGWMSSEGRYLVDYQPDPIKFPNGFKKMVEEIKEKSMIRWFGVWHALGGYWNGVKPESNVSQNEDTFLDLTANGSLVPNLNTGAGFYDAWYKTLTREGIEFTKIDGQDYASIYYENTKPLAKAARLMMEQMEKGATRMDHAIINCMGMAMENVLSRPATAISRNSDDFFPDREGSFREHLLQNAYNALYHDILYVCDWDMFWTKHPYATKHSLLRAISGGPVYFSDRVDETKEEILAPLTYLDGEILMLDHSAKPTEDCIFTDPFCEGILKLYNTGQWGRNQAGVMALYNVTEKEKNFSWMPEDIIDLPCAEEYLVYDFFSKTAVVLRGDEAVTGALESDGYAYYIVLPITDKITCLGLAEKFVGFVAVEEQFTSADKTIVILHEQGDFSWTSENNVSKVIINGNDLTDQVIKTEFDTINLYSIKLAPKKSRMIIEFLR